MPKKPTWNDIDNVYELIGFFLFVLKLHWWKVVVVLFTLGIMATGFTCTYKDFHVEKTPIKASH